MLLDCPACATPYHVNRADLAGGRVVICPRCDARWCVDSDGYRAPQAETARTPRRANADRGRHASKRIADTLFARIRPAVAGVACIVLAMMIIDARENVVRVMPRTAALYGAVGLPVNIRGLAFAHVMPERLDQISQITIKGEIRNVVAQREPVPRLAYEVRDAAGQPLVSWTEKGPANVIAAGKTLAFASMPHLLPDQARSVLVRFDGGDAPVPTSVHNQ